MVEPTRGQIPRNRIIWNTFCFILTSGFFEVCTKYPVRNGEQKAEEPDHQAATMSHHWLFTRIHLHCVNDGQVAVKTDAGQHENATVEIDLMEKDVSKGDCNPKVNSILLMLFQYIYMYFLKYFLKKLQKLVIYLLEISF